MSTARLVIAAPHGRSGKTTFSLGLCLAFRNCGLSVQPFKKGPDFIDPSWLSEAAGRPCRSLDPFFYADPDALQQAFWRAAQADIQIIEGNHGLYDSALQASPAVEEGAGSTAALARLLQAPIILVVNAARMGRSAAALVLGFQLFEPETPIAGVILNQVAHTRHEDKLRQAIERTCRIPVLGVIPRHARLEIPDRHLGLVPRAEDEGLLPALEACRQAVEEHTDLQAILDIARQAPLPANLDALGEQTAAEYGPPVAKSATWRLGVARDRAFTFYYPENLEALQAVGAQLVYFDTMHDEHLPSVDALYLGGGFPEVFMEPLSANRALRQEIRRAAEEGLPIYAECGGMMYLGRRIHWQGRSAEMCGVLPLEVEMTGQPQGHGYVQAAVDTPNPFFAEGSTLRGHEFHQSRLKDWEADWLDLKTAYRLQRGTGLGKLDGSQPRDGLIYRNVLAGYTHLHVGGAPQWARGMAEAAVRFRQAGGGASVWASEAIR